ncbi:hypothetical protein CGCSCA4_v003305 [Colletotrichum siamense]|uniref:P-loop containing nucleoside triphosphate hydrolase protein n=1 Tax=Colletotrichum siamense TaxID=690259 RepID=A0A9P5ETE0_COLSI|nr:hypothetical protein CGCSCA4_v003305 [Colletotrichum siamense]KAF4859247.1 hypothetical protein CGCSCA2_v006309 [Colletotrichum siamense]
MSRMQTDEEKHPELFKPDLNIDRRTCKRVVPLEVLALGMSKTGTSSMQRALMILGYDDVYHGFSMTSNICEVPLWTEGMHAKMNPQPGQKPFGRTEFDQLLGHCGAVCDLPPNFFGPELVRAYPESKVVLVERQFESWYKSFDESIVNVAFNPVWRTLSWLRAKYVAEIDDITFTWLRYQFNSDTKEGILANAREGYKRHYDTIRRETPPERLLNYNLKDGWGPLCEFLEKPIPDVPFPHVNDHEAYHEKLQIIIKKGAKAFARKMVWIAVPGLVGAAAYYFGTKPGMIEHAMQFLK